MAAAIAAALLLVGCRGSRQSAAPAGATATTETPTPATPAATTVQPRVYTVVNFDATVEGVSATGQLRVAEDSVMWISVNKLIELGRAMATPDSVWVNAPLFDKRFSGTYTEVGRMAKRNVSFEQLQEIALADDAEERLQRLVNQMGINATVRITGRKTVTTLRFPFQKF